MRVHSPFVVWLTGVLTLAWIGAVAWCSSEASKRLVWTGLIRTGLVSDRGS